MCRELAAQNGTRVTVDLVTGLEVKGDATRIKQVIINLMTNAVKFAGREGVASLCFERPPHGGVDICIRDTGPGISEGDIDRVFEPFVQAEMGQSRRHGGLGLGLAIARKIARLHGGDVTLESNPGKGTTARFSLPSQRVNWPDALAA
jgi:signal transduction histidine kinase